MPMLLSSEEEWFRTQQRDLYAITYRATRNDTDQDIIDEEDGVDDSAPSAFMQAQIELNNWFEECLPHIPLKVFGPSEYSGFIEGGPRYFTADLDEDAKILFNLKWDKNSAWMLEVNPYDAWRKRVEAANFLPTPLDQIQRVRWWDLPTGIVLQSAYTNQCGYNENGFLSRYDAWWRLQQLMPELKNVDVDAYPYGLFIPEEKGYPQPIIFVEYVCWEKTWDSKKYAADPVNLQRLKQALGLDDQTQVEVLLYE